MKSARNLSMECAKLVAACFVVFLHVPFPGELGGLISCLSRFAVPMFFAISGYFSYQANTQKLAKRLRHILMLEAAAIGAQIVWKGYLASYSGDTLWSYLRETLSGGSVLIKWFLLNVDPFSGHLWYLSAMVSCYAVLWFLVRFHETSYRPLYILSSVFLVIFFCLSEFSPLFGIHVDYIFYRNAWFFGLPMFAMGLFLREYQTCLSRSSGRLLLWMLSGVALSFWEWRILGGWEMYLGTVLFTAALLLLLAKHPLQNGPGFLRMFGSLSTLIYLFHLIILDYYNNFHLWQRMQQWGEQEGWIRPLLILGVSLFTAILLVCVQECFSFLRNRIQTR